jgi:hypothetical protein
MQISDSTTRMCGVRRYAPFQSRTPIRPAPRMKQVQAHTSCDITAPNWL